MSLERERIFELWAPEISPWSLWAKPVLFSYLPAGNVSAQQFELLPPPPVSEWAPVADGRTALVIDLPGVQSVVVGEALASRGFRPVPLFNAVPGPLRDAHTSDSAPRALVDVHWIIDSIARISARSGHVLSGLPSDAPPAFLLDANRREGLAPRPGDFDNRSLSLPTDFPSASYLRARGISELLLVTGVPSRFADDGQPASDLAHTLLRWQVAGLAIRSCEASSTLEISLARRITVTRPSRFGAIWHNALSMLGLRRNPLGGFGGSLPVPSSGG